MDHIKCQCGAIIVPTSLATHVRAKKHQEHPSYSEGIAPTFTAAAGGAPREAGEGEVKCAECGSVFNDNRGAAILHQRSNKHRDAVYARMLADTLKKAEALAIAKQKAEAAGTAAPRLPPPPPRSDNVRRSRRAPTAREPQAAQELAA
jgi:hypothetical protein